MNTDRETRTRIAAMTAAEAAIEADPEDPFDVLDATSAEAADTLGVDARAVYDLADGIIVETLVETQLGPNTRITTMGARIVG
jgi:hypothetical protein